VPVTVAVPATVVSTLGLRSKRIKVLRGNFGSSGGLWKVSDPAADFADLQPHKKCSIIADGTYDSRKREATVFVNGESHTFGELSVEGSSLRRVFRYCCCGTWRCRKGSRMSRPVERLVDVFSTGDSSGAELCARILKSLAKAAWCLWRVSTVFTRSAITPYSAGSEAIWIKIGHSEYIVCLWPWQGHIAVTCRITLNHLSTAAMRLCHYFDHLLSLDAHTVAQIAKRFERSTVLWAFHTIQPSSSYFTTAKSCQ